ncbi:MAG TPA: RluA family pseudouridine synthase [Lachnospiraceae bacterium]|nr:RluA family pseudouridine synthase [Lachnospiraceae bacterium]
MKKLEVIYEDKYIIACVKPCGVPSQGDKSNDVDMVSQVQNYLFDNSESDEEPYVAVIHRLDKPVGGILLFAKDRETAARLSDMQQDGQIEKYYQAVLTGFLPEDEEGFTDYLLTDTKTGTTKVVPKGTKGAKEARLYYEILDEFETDIGPLSYVLIELETGRHHQIRCQMAAHGAPVWGDRRYNPQFGGGSSKGGRGSSAGKYGRGGRNGGSGTGSKNSGEIGLYFSRMEFDHPVTGERIILKAEPEGAAFEAIELDEE